MNWKKIIKKSLSILVPSGRFKEFIKLAFYNISYFGKFRFGISKDGVYYTYLNGIEIKSKQALYNIAPDFDYYEHFYKVKKGDFVIDAGANFGHLSCYFSMKVGDSGIVYAFEPDSINRKSILENLNLNLHCRNNIQLVDLLLWKTTEMVDFCEAGSVGSSAHYIDNLSKIIKKQATSLDEWCIKNQLIKIDLIKMDIEGAEIEAMEGAIEIINIFKPNLAIASYHIVNGKPTYLWLEDFFRELNYPFKTVKFRYNEIITFAGPSVLELQK
jgi:FkbM family methyltransferase